MKSLVKRAQKGDADAFTQLMQSQMQNIYKTARAVLKNDADAADAIADTLLACWEKNRTAAQGGIFPHLMTKILINKCNDILRKRKDLYLDSTVQELPSQTQEYSTVEWMQVMKSLDEKYQLIMILYYVDGLTAAQISEVLQMPASTVRTDWQEGGSRLRKRTAHHNSVKHDSAPSAGRKLFRIVTGGRSENGGRT